MAVNELLLLHRLMKQLFYENTWRGAGEGLGEKPDSAPAWSGRGTAPTPSVSIWHGLCFSDSAPRSSGFESALSGVACCKTLCFICKKHQNPIIRSGRVCVGGRVMKPVIPDRSPVF